MSFDFDRVAVRDVSRHYGRRRALARVSFDCGAGEVLGLLGPNGAGKSTLLSILATLLAPSTGEVLYGDRSGRSAGAVLRSRIGFLSHDLHLYPELTARENLEFFARLYGMDAAHATSAAVALLGRFGLGDRQGDRVGSYSKGMKQKTLIARALVADPELVFLDEPTAGLDPEAAHELMTYIHDLSIEQGRTFFITSHRLEEMEAVCTKVGVLSGGRIAAQGAPADVARMLVPEVRVRVTSAPGTVVDADAIHRLGGVSRVTPVDDGAVVELTTRQVVPAVVRAIAGMPGDLLGVAEEPPTLEEAYLRLVGTQDATAAGSAR